MMQKIAILGGTFNPIHNGHIRLALSCHEEFRFDKILLIPTNLPPHKDAPELCSNEDRLAMCRLAVKDLPIFEVSDIEYRLGGRSYTLNTLCALEEEYKDASFYLLVGSDMFFTFRKWKNYQEILKRCVLIGASRNHEEHKRMLEMSDSLRAEGFETLVIQNEVYVMSSTELRRRIQNGEDVSADVDPGVWEYIQQKSLFSGE